MDDLIKEKTKYEGNGWSNYQKLVLQTLEDHTDILKNMMKEINMIKTSMAVSENNINNWFQNTDREIQILKEDVESILDGNDERSLTNRVKAIEDAHKIEEKSSLRLNAVWGFIGGGVIILIDVLVKVVSLFWRP